MGQEQHFSIWGNDKDDPKGYAQAQEFFRIISGHIKLLREKLDQDQDSKKREEE